MNKKVLSIFMLSTFIANCSVSYGMQTNPNFGKLDKHLYGKVAQYLPITSKEKLSKVCKKSSDCELGYINVYMDLYRIISKSGRVYKTIMEGYKINTAEDFIKIDNIISKHKFKIFCVDNDTFREKRLDRVLTTLYDLSSHCHYIIFPVSYNFYKEYESTLSEEEKEYIVTLKSVEKMLTEKCVYKQFPLENLFRINFKIDENMYPKSWPKNFKEQFNIKLSNFLKRQFIFIQNSYQNSYKVPYETLGLDKMQVLKDYIIGYPTQRLNFDQSVGPFYHCKNNFIYNPSIRLNIDKIYNEKKITQQFDYTSKYGEKVECKAFEHPAYRVFGAYNFNGLNFLSGLSHELFVKDFMTLLTYLDTNKISKLKTDICSNFRVCSREMDKYFGFLFSNKNIDFNAILNLFYILRFSDISLYSEAPSSSSHILEHIAEYILNKIRDNLKDLNESDIVNTYGNNYIRVMEILREILPEKF